ncbi:ATP-dependent zinc metalloprotease FTSH 4, mitochondrial-like [Lingula anatina]|uniref:ATP-dependent zinc metalloprotease FTSH 4, mitochondrial-like n=1 Tax=Lingula anatina TaxID=7574 RepID=A0A2R2MNN1_LINAN|nr:ATP-dependent zinc metalloprotease FTSH 4, mitochondrial-like [Lingula anatina]|eukprot:XP_023931828.1 ATP-dependent zinc metalloprotease FTSH 4, mitochondrial-like [Lingula anatina]
MEFDVKDTTITVTELVKERVDTKLKEKNNVTLVKTLSIEEIDTYIGRLAKLTTGMTSADLANFVNQAALRAAVDGATEVDVSHFDTALDRIRMANRVKLHSHEEKLLTAHHEAGHALVGFYSKGIQKVHKLTILPRSYGSLGHTSFYTEKDVTSLNREQLLGRLDMLLGGRAAEELLVGSGKVTTGASGDCDRASLLAKSMVSKWAMSEKVGLRTLKEDDALSEEHRKEMDDEIKRMLQVGLRTLKEDDALSEEHRKEMDDEIKRMLQESYE